MRSILVGAYLAAWGASLAAAQSTTTTAAPTSSTSLATSTTVVVTTTSITIVTSTTFDPRLCAETSTSKEECRETCCTDAFDDLVASCDVEGACAGDLLTEWQTAGEFYKWCQNTEDPDLTEFDIGSVFVVYNVSKSCRQYQNGCKRVARRQVRGCADSNRCITCCRTAFHRWRASAARTARAQSDDPQACSAAIRCLRKATKKAERCRNACRQAPTCGQDKIQTCLKSSPDGREVLSCYGKCSDKCSNAESYKWCVQACQGLNDCSAFDECILGEGGGTSTTTTVTSPSTSSTAGSGSTSTSLAGGLQRVAQQACLVREEPAECVRITTTSTSSTTSTSRTTTSTSSSTSTTSPLLVSGV